MLFYLFKVITIVYILNTFLINYFKSLSISN